MGGASFVPRSTGPGCASSSERTRHPPGLTRCRWTPAGGGPAAHAARNRRGLAREDGRIVNVCAVVATGVTAEGKREILGVDVVSAEDGAARAAFLRGLVARGLRGLRGPQDRGGPLQEGDRPLPQALRRTRGLPRLGRQDRTRPGSLTNHRSIMAPGAGWELP